MQAVSRDETKDLLIRNPRMSVIEVLEQNYYTDFHLPGAKNVPLDETFDQHIQQTVPDKEQPVLVYCMDSSCQASPKAARRMEALGYKKVYDYEAGKMDWKAAGLPVET
jgi:rhodanese-related sulfurtransferase